MTDMIAPSLGPGLSLVVLSYFAIPVVLLLWVCPEKQLSPNVRQGSISHFALSEVFMLKFCLASGFLMLAMSSGQAQTKSSDRLAITQVEDAWRRARIDGDTGFLERFYAKEGRIQGMDGKVQSRSEDIALFASGTIKPKFIDHGPLDISTYGNIAVVTGVDHLGGTAFGHYGEMYLRFTDVLVRRDGRWQLVVQQTTPTSGF